MRGLNWQKLEIPFAAGLNQKADERAMQPPQLAEALDVQFDELGGLQTRKPFSLVGSTIAGGGTISTARRFVPNGNEMVVFTKDSVYSWNDQLDRLVFRATHLAVAVEEKTTYATPGDQYDCDRAELAGIVFHAWTDTSKVYMAATDKASGAVLLAPTAVTGTTHTRPRLVALASRVLLFCHEGTDSVVGNITVRSFDPTSTDPATWSGILGAAGTTVLAAANCGAYYDVCRLLTRDLAVFAARRAVTTSYTVASIEANGAVTAATPARVCDGPIAVASHPAGTFAQVVRANGTNIQGDYLDVSLVATTPADVTTGQAVGTVSSGPVNQIAAAYRSTQDGGAYRCYAFWTHDEETGAGDWQSRSNYVDTAGALGTQATFIRRLGIGSRAFDHDGRVFVWGVFAGESSFSGASPSAFRSQLQNSYFLYRDDATLHAKCAFGRGGGLAPSTGRLPGVALTSGTTVYSWCATERRIIPIGTSGKQYGYDARAPRDVRFTFDSNAARRCVKLGETLYISGAEILQYDGVGLYEIGFHVYPWYFGLIEVAAGNLADGTYTYKVTVRWENAKGELDRSTTATHGNVTIAAGPNGGSIVSWPPLYITHKLTAKPIAFEVWRTLVNPGDGAPMFLATSKDPAATTNPNRYIANDITASSLPTFNDEFADATLGTKEESPENGSILENLAPPGATVIAATDTRVFLGNVSDDPDRIWYSQLRQAGKVVSFHDNLRFDVPRDGGAITGIAFQNGVCVVFREYATYMFPGEGFDNTGHGQNYGPHQVVSESIGCRDTDSIVVTPEGIAFQSGKGKYLLTRGWTMKPIGLAVADFDSEAVLAAHVVPSQHQVRFLTGARIIVWDYLVDAWAHWTLNAGVLDASHAGIWQGTYHYLAGAGPYAELTSFGTSGYGLDVETGWIKPNDQQGQAAVRKLQVLAAYMSSCYVRVRVAYDYKDTWVDDSYWTPPSGLSAGDPVTIPCRPSRQKLESIKLRLTVYGAETKATLATGANLPLLDPSGNWTATLRSKLMGPLGNGKTLTIGTVAAAAPAVEVRDGQKFTTATGLWTALAGNVGVKISGGNDVAARLDILTLEGQISRWSEVLEVSVEHASPFAYVDFTTIGSSTITISSTAGGAFAAPTGESLKLTGLGLEVGIEPKLHKRFAR